MMQLTNEDAKIGGKVVHTVPHCVLTGEKDWRPLTAAVAVDVGNLQSDVVNKALEAKMPNLVER